MNNLNPANYIAIFRKLQEQELDITIRKNADYSWDALAFKNFDMVEKLWICSAETWILVRMTDKLSRIITLLQSNDEPKVKDEKITDTLADLSNYARILNVYILTKDKWTLENSMDTNLDSLIKHT